MTSAPEILVPVRVDGRFRIRELIGSGTYGRVYRAVNIFTNKSYAVKLELAVDGGCSVEHEYEVLRSLGGGEGIPRTHWFGREANYDGLVLDLLGPSLHELMNKHKTFHIHTVAHIADQLISRLQYIHGHGFVHGDIKPQNVLVGLGDDARTVFIVDFGIANPYREPTTGDHIPFLRARRLTGTPAFASINSHLGAQLGRRDDVESLAYILVYFLCGSLPWLTRSCGVSKPLILELKRKIPVEQLCRGLPREIATFFTYTRTLSFSEEPDYDYLRSLLQPLHTRLSDSPEIAHDLSIDPQMDCARQVSTTVFPEQARAQSPLLDTTPAPTPRAKIAQASTTANLHRRKRSAAAAGIVQTPRKVLSSRILRSAQKSRDARRPAPGIPVV